MCESEKIKDVGCEVFAVMSIKQCTIPINQMPTKAPPPLDGRCTSAFVAACNGKATILEYLIGEAHANPNKCNHDFVIDLGECGSVFEC